MLLAQEAGTCGSVLESIFNRALHVAKRVRTETRVAELPVSVSSAAVELAAKAVGDLHDKSVLIIGAGQMGELAARHLVAKGASTVLVSNRTHAQAVALARELNGLAIHFGPDLGGHEKRPHRHQLPAARTLSLLATTCCG